MKEELINNILFMLSQQGIPIDGLHDRLTIIFQDVECKPMETSLVPVDETTNERLLKAFLASKIVKGCTKQTVESYAKGLRKILERIGKPVPELTPDDIRLYIAVRLTKDKITKITADTEVRYLKTFFAYLAANDLVTKNIMACIDKVKGKATKKKAFTDMECEKIRSVCKNNKEKALVEVLFSTGCRVSEIASMRFDEVESGKVIVHGKGEKDRFVYLNAKAQLALEVYSLERKDRNPYIFPACFRVHENPLGKKFLEEWWKHPELVREGCADKGSIERIIRKIGERAGVENCHPHRFRRTCATAALRKGMPLEQVSKMLGHEQLTTTQIYLDLQEEELEIAHKKYVT